MDAEVVFSWRWHSLLWLEQVVELPPDLDSPLTQVCQHGFVFPELFSYLSFPDVEYEYLVLTRLCHCSAGFFRRYQVDGRHASHRLPMVVNLSVSSLLWPEPFQCQPGYECHATISRMLFVQQVEYVV